MGHLNWAVDTVPQLCCDRVLLSVQPWHIVELMNVKCLKHLGKYIPRILVFFFPVRGVEPYDKPTTVYIERNEPTGSATILRSTDFFQTRENKEILLEEVEDFQLRDKYLFATKSVVRHQPSSHRAVEVPAS